VKQLLCNGQHQQQFDNKKHQSYYKAIGTLELFLKTLEHKFLFILAQNNRRIEKYKCGRSSYSPFTISYVCNIYNTAFTLKG
jgi:hypothetical protein